MSEAETSNRDSKNSSSLRGYKDKKPKQKTSKEAMFNLVNFMETLIAMDRQQQEWKENNNNKENGNG